MSSGLKLAVSPGRIIQRLYSAVKIGAIFPLIVLREFQPINLGKLVEIHFRPVADRFGLSIREISAEVFEIKKAKSGFSIRVRDGTGHQANFSISLRPPGLGYEHDVSDMHGEIGVRVVAEFYRQPLKEPDIFTPGIYRRAFAEAADRAEKFLIPYVIGERTSIEEIRTFIEEKIWRSEVRNDASASTDP